jgi:hypothetical protein
MLLANLQILVEQIEVAAHSLLFVAIPHVSNQLAYFFDDFADTLERKSTGRRDMDPVDTESIIGGAVPMHVVDDLFIARQCNLGGGESEGHWRNEKRRQLSAFSSHADAFPPSLKEFVDERMSGEVLVPAERHLD